MLTALGAIAVASVTAGDENCYVPQHNVIDVLCRYRRLIPNPATCRQECMKQVGRRSSRPLRATRIELGCSKACSQRCDRAKYGGELFIASSLAAPPSTIFIDFFQTDKATGAPKGHSRDRSPGASMITNERQNRISHAQIKRFEQAIAQARTDGPAEEVDPLVHEAMIAGMDSQLQDLRGEVGEYRALREGRVKSRTLRSLLEIPDALIQGRIAGGLTQKRLAEKLGVSEQQIQRYEQSRYRGANIERLQEVADALQLTVAKTIEYHTPARRAKLASAPKLPGRRRTSGAARATPKERSIVASRTTGKAAAKAAGKVLSSPSAGKHAKRAAASDLAQVKNNKTTGKKAASAASKTLRSKRSSKAAKRAAGSDLSQAARKKQH
jgi:transcriptional regulator with XRE-family HTH domain